MSKHVRREIIAKMFFENGISQEKICLKLEMTRSAVRRALKKSGVETDYYTNLDEKKVIQLYVDEHLSQEKIMKMFGCSRGPVTRILKKRGLIRNMSDCHKGQIAHNKGISWTMAIKEKLSKARKGRFKGDQNPNWRGGIKHPTINPVRVGLRYKEWDKKVKNRDDWTCKWCKSKERVESHHIIALRFITEEELIYDINNGITLCKKCHLKLANKEQQFEVFMSELLRS